MARNSVSELDEQGDEPLECLDARPDAACVGEVRYRFVGSGHARFPRCEKHGEARVAREVENRRNYPDSPIPPSWFDPAAAGESWDEPE